MRRLHLLNKGDLSLEHVATAILLLALLVTLLIYTGLINIEAKDIIARFLSLLTER